MRKKVKSHITYCQLAVFTFSVTSMALLFLSKEYHRSSIIFGCLSSITSAVTSASIILLDAFGVRWPREARRSALFRFSAYLSLSVLLVSSGIIVIIQCQADYCDSIIFTTVAGLMLTLAAIFTIFLSFVLFPRETMEVCDDDEQKDALETSNTSTTFTGNTLHSSDNRRENIYV
jgi:hypothetical protein